MLSAPYLHISPGSAPCLQFLVGGHAGQSLGNWPALKTKRDTEHPHEFFWNVWAQLCSWRTVLRVGWCKTKSSSGKGRGGSINNLCRWNKSYKTSLYFFFLHKFQKKRKKKKVTHKPKLHKYILSNTEYTKDGSQRYFCINATPPHQIIFHESSMFLSHPGLFTVVIHCPLRD